MTGNREVRIVYMTFSARSTDHALGRVIIDRINFLDAHGLRCSAGI